jgi:hypothetical protein
MIPQRLASRLAQEVRMAAKLQPGDRVSWDTSQGKTRGTVSKKLMKKTRIKGQVTKASQDDPKYLVRSARTGAKAAHKSRALKRR